MIDVKQNFVSIATVISILGLIYLALWRTKTLGCCLVRRKASQVFQMRRIEKSFENHWIKQTENKSMLHMVSKVKLLN